MLVMKFNGDVRQNIADSATDQLHGLLYQAALEYIPGQDVTLLYCFTMQMDNIKQLFCRGDWFWPHAQQQTLSVEPVDDNLNSLLDYRKIIRSYGPKVEYSPQELEARTLKRFSIRLDSGYSSTPVDFNCLDELKEYLKNRHNAKRLVPVNYTPWDSKDFDEKRSCEVDKLTLAYLYRYHSFESRRY